MLESRICPALPANAGTWTKIVKQTVKKLDDLQNLFLQVLLKVPSSTPKPAYRAETGLLGMQWRIWREKLMLVFALKELDKNALAREVFDEQMEMGWPGLGLEAEEICRTIGIPNICTEDVGKAEVKEAIMYHHMKEMKEEIKNKNYQKICNLVNEDLRKGQPYMKEKSLEFCRMAFRLRTHQFNCRGNLHGKYREGDRWCRSCSSSEEAGPGGD